MIAAASLVVAQTSDPPAPVADRLGVTHVDGRYHLTDKPYLDEGADVIQALGSRVIKVYLSLGSDQPSARLYRFNHDFREAHTLAQLAESPPYRRLFERPFTTFILSVYRPGKSANYWRESLTAEDEQAETRECYELALHLLTTYRGSGKTFVFQHWEGDWSVLGRYDPQAELDPGNVQRMIRWLRARQAGVDRARSEARAQGVRVLHAAEVNLVKRGMVDNRPCVTTEVLPHAGVDLVSYSAYDTQQDPAMLRRALDFIAHHTPDRPPLGDRNVYIGEFGFAENVFARDRVENGTRAAIDTALDWGCPYVVYWQVYCNEPIRPGEQSNHGYRGYWLIRPDGSQSISHAVMRRYLR